MLNRLRNFFTGQRSYQAAQGGRRGSALKTMHSPIASAAASRGTLAARARYVVANDPLGAAAVQAWTAQAIGTGIKPSSLHPDPAIRAALSSLFSAWTDVADDEGRTDWYGQQTSLLKSMIVSGEGLALMLNSEQGLRIRILDPEQLDASYSAQLTTGRIIQGIEFNNSGQRVAYHIWGSPIGLDLAFQRQRKRIPAEDVIHCFRPDWPGMVRGCSWFSPALVRLADLSGWRDAELMRQRTSSMFAGFVVNSDGSEEPLKGEQSGSTVVGGLEPGTLQYLAPGEDIRFSDPAKIGAEVIDFAAICEREVAIALGLPAHAFGDVASANYSSLKSANTAWKARVESFVWSVFIYQVCLPVWRRWATITVLSGAVSTTVEAAMPVKHICPVWPSLEPVKDSTAANMDLAGGLTTRRQILAERGEDIEEVDRILAEDNERAARLGLSFSTSTMPANDNEPPAAQAA